MNWNLETNHMMVDLETLGMREDALILSASGVVFNSKDIVDSFYLEFDWNNQDCTTVVPDTIAFWMKQAAGGKPYPQGKAPITELTETLNRFYTDYKCETLWANGTDFDIPMLKFRFESQKFTTPWKYNAVRDCRTVFKLFERSVNLDHLACTEKHNALADAVYQVQKLQCVLNALNDLEML